MPKAHSAQNQDALSSMDSLTGQFISALEPRVKYDSVIDFACHTSFCGKKLYPRQQTLLRLMYLETEHMTQYDLDVIEEWRSNFSSKGKNSYGVQQDIWKRIEYLKERGYRHFPHIESVMGRRASKGMIGGILGAEKLSYLMSLDNWQDYYGVEKDKDGYLSVIATNMLQSKKFLFADIRQTVENCKSLQKNISTSNEYYLSLRTPADLRRIAEMTAKRIPVEHEIATLRCLAMASTSSSGRGGVGFANFFDEFAHLLTTTEGPRSSQEIYEAYQPALDEFGKDSLTYLPSSPYTKIGYFYNLYVFGSVLMQEYLEEVGLPTPVLDNPENKDPEEVFEDLTADPEMLIVQLPSWELYRDWERGEELCGVKFKRAIQVYDDRMKRLEKRNPTKFKVERKAQFADVQDAYLDPDKVDAMFEPFWDNRVLEQTNVGTLAYIYEGHSDPGRSNANFAVCIAHLEQAPLADEYGHVWSHVIIDHLHVWKPEDYPDHIVDYVEVEKDLEILVGCYPALRTFSFDAWNSGAFIAMLKEKFRYKPRIVVEPFNDKKNQQRAEYFKSALNLGWIHSYKDKFFGDGQSLLETELKFLTEINGKVEKQTIGPCTTKDLADTVMVVTHRLLHQQLDQWQRELLGKIPMSKGMPGGRLTDSSLSSLSLSRKIANYEKGSARSRILSLKDQRSRARRSGAGGSRYR